MPVRVDPAAAADKWASRLSGATQEITAGINRVTEAPGVKAANKKAKWIAAIQASQDKWERNVRAVTLDQWKQYTLQVGVPRIAQGANAKKGKYTQFAQQFYPHLDQGIQKLASMPDITLEDRINKAVAMMRHNASFKRSATGA